MSMSPYHDRLIVGTFALRGLVASLLNQFPSLATCLPHTSFYIGRRTRKVHASLHKSYSIARLVTPLSLCTRCCLWPRGDGKHSSITCLPAWPAPKMRGSAHSPKFRSLGAMCQIQGYTLHLVTLAYLSIQIPPSKHYTNERLTKPYSWGPLCPSQQRTSARLPIKKLVSKSRKKIRGFLYRKHKGFFI